MKKTKIVLATVAVASLAVSCGILAACDGNTADTKYDVTFDANGGVYAEELETVTLTAGEDGKLEALPEAPTYVGHEFNGYNTLADGTGEEVTVDYEYSAKTTVYAQWVNIYNITYVVGTDGELASGASATATTSMAKLASLPEVTVTANKKSFLGWYTTASGEGEQVTTEYTFTGDTTDVSLYARYRDEYTVTLTAGNGTFDNSVITEYITVGGKINGYLPAEGVTSTAEDWHFGGWMDSEGADVDEREYVFTQDTQLTAKYVQNDGLWSQDGNTLLAGLVLNTGNTDTSLKEYWFGAGKDAYFEEGTVITVYIDGVKQENFWLKGSCVDLSADVNNYGGITTTEITVSEDATFDVYVKLYNNGGTTYEFNGKPDRLPETNTLPAGATALTITVKESKDAAESLGVITIYLIGKDGQSVQCNPESEDYDSAANYQIHAWQGSDVNLFGEWNSNPNFASGNVDLVYANASKNTIFMFHNASGWQTGNISGMEIGRTYVINLQNSSAQEYVAPAADAE